MEGNAIYNLNQAFNEVLSPWFDSYGLLIIITMTILTIWEFVARWRKGKAMLHYSVDAVNSLLSYVFLGIISRFILLFGVGYTLYYQMPIYQLPPNLWTVLLAFIACDLAYYWEHRGFHRINVLWATHTVHHSSPYINTPMAARFGPLDTVISDIWHLPLAFFFDPSIIFIAIVSNQAYQGLLHTDRIKSLGFLEKILNTPSHHRVHHGRDAKYLDKNYTGILIIWDKLFGTFQAEEETPNYGVTVPMTSLNPLIVFFHGFWRFGQKLLSARSVKEVFLCFMAPPEWETKIEALKRISDGSSQDTKLVTPTPLTAP